PSQCSCSGTDVKCDWRQLASVPARIPTTTQRLWLNNNQITKLDPGGMFDRLGNLQWLGLHVNQLKSVPRGA
uniref:Variable lymphocyte receptor B cassette n=1 Tax=Petromyzon marinus TaxID=7757 RepID=S4RV25_PETMA